jgi:hypothetical protein
LDAVFSARELSCYVKGEPNIGLLFPNYREVERAYYRPTKNFSINVVGIKKELVARYPWLPGTVYKAFCQAKKIAIDWPAAARKAPECVRRSQPVCDRAYYLGRGIEHRKVTRVANVDGLHRRRWLAERRALTFGRRGADS